MTTTEAYLQFSRAPTAANYGDLPRGEIPDPLKFNRPFRKALFLLLCCLLSECVIFYLIYYNFAFQSPLLFQMESEFALRKLEHQPPRK